MMLIYRHLRNFAELGIRKDIADSMLEGILNVTTWRQISEGIFGYKPKVTSIFGAPIGISEGTVFVDIDTDTYGVADNGDKIRISEVNNDQKNGKDSDGDKENNVDHNPVKDFMLYSGFVGSYLESFVLEETVGVFAVSTMEVFKVALSRGMELVKIDSQNSDGFEKIKADDKTLSEMKNAVKEGRTIIVPKEEMCYYGWKGTAYIALDTSTGEGAYMISGSMCGGSTAINIIVGTINVIIAAYDLIAAIDMIILGLANPVLLTVALVFLGVAVYAYIDSMFTLFMYCSTGEERYGEEMMTNLYFNVTFGVITKVAGTLGKKVVRKIGDTLVEMGVDSKYVKNFFTEEFGGVSWDDSPGTGGSGSHGSGSGSHGTGEIPGGGSGNHGSGGTGGSSGSHGTGYIPGGGSPDYWNFIDAWELLSKKYGEKVASILQEFGEDGLKLAEKYGDDLARIIDNLEPTEAKKAVSLINSYGDEALEMFKEGKSFDEVKKVIESGIDTSWYKPDGSINYPPNNGAVPGTEVNMTLKPGDTLGRYGNIGEKSNFVIQTGADASKLTLPPNTNPAIYQEFEVIKEIPGTIQAEIAPWGGSAGGGLQYELPKPILQLIKEGYIVPK